MSLSLLASASFSLVSCDSFATSRLSRVFASAACSCRSFFCSFFALIIACNFSTCWIDKNLFCHSKLTAALSSSVYLFCRTSSAGISSPGSGIYSSNSACPVCLACLWINIRWRWWIGTWLRDFRPSQGSYKRHIDNEELQSEQQSRLPPQIGHSLEIE